MKLKTRNLTGRALDWAVTKSITPNIEYRDSLYLLEYSTDPEYANVLIEMHNILVHEVKGCWTAAIEGKDGQDLTVESGPTREVAAMQCFAASRIGEFIDVPDVFLFTE